MGVSAIQEQRNVIIQTIKQITRGDWKVLVVDEASRKIIDNVVREDDILNENIANIESIEEKRSMNPDMDAIYIISPKAHILECLLHDLTVRRYRKAFLVWTGLLDRQLRQRLDGSPTAKSRIGGFETLNIDYFPRESHLITFRDPWSFPILFHPACNNLVREHMQLTAQKIAGICITLGEYPKVRYYRPRNPIHEASVLCSHLARFVQEELDAYAQYNPEFPPQTARPQGLLLITDRSMDVYAPVVHEFTYQAMAHDLLKIKEGDKVTYKTVINEGTGTQQEKEVEISEKDKIWVDNRHRHMKDTIEKLMADFQKFIEDNPNFTKSEDGATSLNAIKDMLAGLPQFQELKEAYSLHLSMAQECMGKFTALKLPDVASVEQTLATGLDEDYKRPKNVADQLVRLLDDESIGTSDRLRLIILYVLFKDGLLPADMQKLLAHSGLPPQDAEVINNLDLLGVRSSRQLKENRPPLQPMFPRKPAVNPDEEYALSRFEPNLKLVLDEVAKGTLDQQVFPYTVPPLDGEEMSMASQSSLRSAKPTWARNRMSTLESRQRVMVFIAGGATFSEARACYEMSKISSRDIFLATSHMMTPALFIRQVRDLSVDRRRLDLPVDRPKPKPPAYIYESDRSQGPSPSVPGAVPGRPMGIPGGLPPGPGGSRRPSATPNTPSPQPPVAGMGAMTLNSQSSKPLPNKLQPPAPGGKPEKKKKGFFSSKK